MLCSWAGSAPTGLLRALAAMPAGMAAHPAAGRTGRSQNDGTRAGAAGHRAGSGRDDGQVPRGGGGSSGPVRHRRGVPARNGGPPPAHACLAPCSGYNPRPRSCSGNPAATGRPGATPRPPAPGRCHPHPAPAPGAPPASGSRRGPGAALSARSIGHVSPYPQHRPALHGHRREVPGHLLAPARASPASSVRARYAGEAGVTGTAGLPPAGFDIVQHLVCFIEPSGAYTDEKGEPKLILEKRLSDAEAKSEPTGSPGTRTGQAAGSLRERPGAGTGSG